MIKSFPKNQVKPTVLLPKGTSRSAFQADGIDTIECKGLSQLDNTQYSYYRGMRWLILLREFFLLPFTLFTFIRLISKRKNFDLVHINDLTNLPSVWLAAVFLRLPIIVHVRSVQRKSNGFRNRLIDFSIKKLVEQVIAIDETVADSLNDSVNPVVIHNGLIVDKIPVNRTIQSFNVGMVGNLFYLKGVMEFAKAAKLAQENNLHITFSFYGSRQSKPGVLFRLKDIMGVNQDASKELQAFVLDNNLMSTIRFEPFNNHLKSLYENIDILCFPSHLNAAGRPVFEAALYGIPSIVAIENPKSDTIIHNVTGICINKGDYNQLFDAIRFLYNNPELRKQMGVNAQKHASETFNVEKNALKVFHIYKKLAKSAKD